MSNDFIEWNGGYDTNHDYEVLLHSGVIIKCYIKNGFVWELSGSGKYYTKEEIKGIRTISTTGGCTEW